jgi:HJR/Mrr/RecB family endonuclease
LTGLFSELGFEAVHTGRSGDGGADIVLFKENGRDAWGIVECKRYSKDRRVRPEILRALVGAAVDFGVRRAYLVTTGRVSDGFKNKVIDFRTHGYELELLQATEILKLLGVYSTTLPSLDKLSEAVRAEIVTENRRLWRNEHR